MPRKRRSKKDPVAQKLDFDEEPDEATSIEDSRETNRTPENEAHPWNSGGVLSPETGGPPAASEQPGYAELIPTDFAHRDRLRFTRPGGLEENDDSPNRFLISCVCLICLILVVRWIKTEGYNLCLKWYFELWDRKGLDEMDNGAFSFLGLPTLGFLWSLMVSFLLGLSCLLFSWGITYQDSLQPGEFPPSPVSPKKFRKQSGHTFHSSYVMAMISGVAVFILSAWWLCT